MTLHFSPSDWKIYFCVILGGGLRAVVQGLRTWTSIVGLFVVRTGIAVILIVAENP
jgi:hypothetical protein